MRIDMVNNLVCPGWLINKLKYAVRLTCDKTFVFIFSFKHHICVYLIEGFSST
jgi:hypothetical protein